MAVDPIQPENKSCRWLNHCCWHKGLCVAIIIVLFAGLFYSQKNLKNQMNIIAEKLQKGTPGQLKTQVDNISLLITLANAEIRTFGKKQGALELLAQAQKQTQALPATPLRDALLTALTADRQTLSGIKTISLTEVSQRINALIQQTDALIVGKLMADPIPVKPITDENANPAPVALMQEAKTTTTPIGSVTSVQTTQMNTTTNNPPVPTKNWHDKLQAGWEQLKDLVKIESKGASDNVIEAWLVPAKLTLQLEELKLFAFYRNNQFFHTLANDTVSWINTHYDVTKDEKVKAVRDEIESMKTWVLAPNRQVLKQTMDAVDNLKKSMENT